MKRIQLTNGTKLMSEELAAPDSKGTPRVMTLLLEKLLNPENVPEKLLVLTDNFGTSVLDICIERFQEPVPDGTGQTLPRALFLAGKYRCELPPHFRNCEGILAISREDGWSVAHEMALRGLLPESVMTEEILKLTDASGCSVAYNAAWHKFFPDWAKKRKDILMLDNGQGDYVVHVLARREYLPSEIMTEDILKLTNTSGCSVAYSAAWYACFPDWAKRSRDILLLDNGQGDFVAHALAKQGTLPVEMMIPEILRLENKRGLSTLAMLVSERHLSPEILMLPWDEKIKVFEYLLSESFQKQKPKEKDMVYIEKQLTALEVLLRKKAFGELSIRQHQDLRRETER